MKKISKLHRLMAMFLTLVMIFGTLPVTALAEGIESHETGNAVQAPQQQEHGKGKNAAATAQPQTQKNGEAEKSAENTAEPVQPQTQESGETAKTEETVMKPDKQENKEQGETAAQTPVTKKQVKDENAKETENAGADDKADSAAAKEVSKKIEAIGEINADSKSLIDEARKAYESLNAATKLLVKNADKLTEAEKVFAALNVQQESEETAGLKFGSSQTELAAGTYIIPLSLMKSDNINESSMAGTCIEGGDVTISENGEAWVTVYLKPVSVGSLSDWSGQWQIYNEYKVGSGYTAAEVLFHDEEGHETAIRFKVPDNSWDGVYCSMFVPIMGKRPDAYIAFNYASATPGKFTPGAAQAELDKQAAQGVIELIDAIGENVSLESQEAVKAAKDAYDKLTEAQRLYVTNVEKLTNAENTIKDMQAAKSADDLIAAIGTVDAKSGEAIKAARQAFDNLSETQKGYVKNLTVLTDAEKTFEEVKKDLYHFGSAGTVIMPGTHQIGVAFKKADNPSKDSMASGCVKGGSIEVMEDGTAFINVSLGSVSMMGITGWASDWKIFNEYKASGEATPAEIVSTDGRGHVTQIRFKLPDNSWDGVYANLTVKASIINMKPDAFLKLDFTNAGGGTVPAPSQEEIDAAAAKYVSDKISNIGTVTIDSAAKIEEAHNEFEKLTPAQKALVKNIQVLRDAEKKLEELKSEINFEFGSAKTVLKPGTYNLPISMMNAGNIANPSMAADCVKGGSIEVMEDGTAYINVKLGAKNMAGMTGWASDWKIYNEYKAGGEFTPAEEISKDAEGHVTEIRFKLNNNSWDGVYSNLSVMVNGGVLMSPDAYLKLDFANAGNAPTPEPEPEKPTYEFGSAKTVIMPGTHYLPVSMMNADKITDPSMAGDCVKGGSIEVMEDGTAYINVKLGAKNMAGKTGWATDWKIYNEYKADGEFTPAEIVAKDSENNVTEIRFKLNDNSWDGAYSKLTVIVTGIGELMSPNAYLKFDFANVDKEPAPEPEIRSYPVNFSAGSNGTITASVEGTEIKSGDMVEEGKKVIFTAKADEGFEVESWEGAEGNGNAALAEVNGEITVKVNFCQTDTKVLDGFSKGRNYDTYAKVTVKGDVITGVELSHDAAEKYPDSLNYAEMAREGMQDKFTGKSATDKAVIESIDAVSGATGTSEGFKKAVLNALGLDKTPGFEFGSAKTKLLPGTYTVPISLRNASQHETASVAGGAFAPTAKLTVNEEGTAVLEARMQSVSMGPIKDLAYNVNYYKEDNYTSQDYPVNIVETVISPEGMVSAGKEVPSVISFTIPNNSFDGVYMNFTVDAMGGASPDAWLRINYAGAGEPGGGDDKTFKGSAKVDQFGKYTIDAEVSVEDGLITDVKVSARDFVSPTHVDTNKVKIEQVTKGLKSAWNGMAPTQENAEKIFNAIMKPDNSGEVLDAVSGATYSAKAVRDAVMDAFKLEYQDEIINVPVEVKPGVYQVDISYYSDVVLHSLVENEKTTATLTVNADKTMSLDFDLRSGTKKEPLYILGFNGVHTDNDRSKALTMDGCSTVMGLSSNNYADEYFEKGTQVVNHVTFPLLGGLTDIYNTNCYLYVPVMNKLDGDLSGVHFDHGKFSVDVFAKVFWDSMKKIDDVPMPKPPVDKDDIHNLADGSYIINGTLLKPDKATASMADQGINHQILLNVSNGNYTLTLDFAPISFAGQKGYLGNLNYYLSGYAVGGGGKPVGAMGSGSIVSYQTYTDGTKVKDEFGTDYPDRVSFPMIPEALDDGWVPLQVFVPIMDSITPGSGYQDVYLCLDLNSIRSGSPGSSSNDNTLPQDAIDVTDKATGVRVTADKGTFKEKVKLVVREITSGKQREDAAKLLKDKGTAFKLYEVSFENEKGEKVQPTGKVTVYYPIPDGFNEKELALYNIRDDGKIGLIKGSVKDGYYVAVQKHFSTYALVDKSTLAEDENAKSENAITSAKPVDKVEDSRSTAWIWVTVSVAAVAAVAAFFTLKFKKQQKTK